MAANLLTGAKTTQKRQQFGGTLGGPLKKDVSHYFVNYEDTDIDDAAVVTSVLAPGTFAAPQRQQQGFFKLNNRFSDRTTSRRAIQLQPQQAGNAGRRRAEHVRAPQQHRGTHRRVHHIAA